MCVQGPASASRQPELNALATNRSLAMPLLPTLATAVVIACLSLLCRQPSAPEPSADPVAVAAALPMSADSLQRQSEPSDPATAIPATVAFGQLYPLTPEAASAAASRPTPARLATARRAPKRDETVRSAANPPRPQPAPLPFREAADRAGEALPEGALPFAPTAAAVVDTVRSFGGDAVTLSGSVLASLALLR